MTQRRRQLAVVQTQLATVHDSRTIRLRDRLLSLPRVKQLYGLAVRRRCL